MGRRFSGFTTKVVLSGGGSLGMMRKRAMFGGARVEGRWLGGWGATHVFLFLPQVEEIKYSFFSFIVRIGFCFVRIGFQFFVTFYQICTLIDWWGFFGSFW